MLNKNFFIPGNMQFPEPYRNRRPGYSLYDSEPGDPFGLFDLVANLNRPGIVFRCIVSNGDDSGWEHVSVVKYAGATMQTCTWDEMCWIKDQFWTKDACVVQYHPAQSEYVNNHPHCLHLWRSVRTSFPTPPTILVGYK